MAFGIDIAQFLTNQVMAVANTSLRHMASKKRSVQIIPIPTIVTVQSSAFPVDGGQLNIVIRHVSLEPSE